MCDFELRIRDDIAKNSGMISDLEWMRPDR
jgi:hypothetical protein